MAHTSSDLRSICRAFVAAAIEAEQFGPETIEEVCLWPETVLKTLVSAEDSGLLAPGGLERLKASLQKGVSISSNYSGMAGDVMGCQWMEQARPQGKRFGWFWQAVLLTWAWARGFFGESMQSNVGRLASPPTVLAAGRK